MAVSIEQVLQKAKRFAKKGQNDLAAEQYKSILEAFPNNQRALAGLRSLQSPAGNAPHQNRPQHGIPQGGYPQGGFAKRGFAPKRPRMPDRTQIEKLIGLYNQGQLQQALKLSEELAAAFPNALAVFNIMGAINAAMGNLEAAVTAYTKARDIDPKIAEIHNNLGLALNKLGHHQQAVDCYQQAVKLKPDYAGAYNNMGLAICDLGKPKEAIDCYLKALKINSDFAEVYNNIGIAQNRLHLHDKAVISYDKAIEINADIAEVHKNKGIALILMGKNAEAMDALTKSLHSNSDIPDAELLYHFSEIPASFASIDLLSILEKFQKDNAKDFEPIEATGLNLIKATFLHNAGRFEEAWNILVTENQSIMDQLGSEFPDDMKNNQDFLQQLRDQAPDALTGNLSDNNLPVTLFLLGPSRSGKSTLEHMVSASPNANQGYESSVLDNALYFAANEAGIGECDYLDDLPTEYDDRLKKHYADLVRNFAAPGQVYTTTAPGIIRNINRAALTLPNVRMVFVKRNIDDNTLRIFMKQYRSSNSYAYNIDNIRKFITWYNEMIDLLHSRFPQISIVVNYEDIIAQPEKTLQAVSDLCGIDLSSGEVSVPGDDRGCAKPYLQWMTAVSEAGK